MGLMELDAGSTLEENVHGAVGPTCRGGEGCRPARDAGLRHFRLREAPFAAEPDERFHVEPVPQRPLLEALLSAVQAGHSVVKVTGASGSGKTLLCRRLLLSLGTGYRGANLASPGLTPLALLRTLAEQLGAPAAVAAGMAPRQQQAVLLQALQARLRMLAGQGQRVLVCVDDAQDMLPQTLQVLDRFLDLAACGGRPPQVVLIGEGELDESLCHPAARSLALRIEASWRLGRLGPRALARYLSERMAVAGHGGAPVFGTAACWLMLLRTRGLPARVNALAAQALLQAGAQSRATVGLRQVWRAIADTSPAWARLPRLGLALLSAWCLALLLLPVG